MLETKLLLRIILIASLVLSVGALGGGLSLMMAPDGSFLEMPVVLLENTPFKDYFIPGLILFIFIGLFSGYIFFRMIFGGIISPIWIAAQGFVLFIWMVVQIWMIGYHSLIQLIFLLFGIKLILIAIIIHNRLKSS